MNNSLKNILTALEQAHLIEHCESLTEEEKAQFLETMSEADFNKLALAFSAEKQGLELADGEISPQEFTKKSDYASEVTYREGLELLQNGKGAILIMSGGMGSRLGFEGPKGAFPLIDGKSIFEIHVDKLHAIKKETGFAPSLLLMCSDLNFDSTKNFFESRGYFGYPEGKILFFKQGNIPACDENYKVLLESKTSINRVPDGNGGVFDALQRYGLLKRLREEGVKWLQIAGVDNVLLRILDPVFLSFAESSGAHIASSSVERLDESEKVGVFVQKNARPAVLEYGEIPEFLLSKRTEEGDYLLSEANIANHLFHLESPIFDQCSNLNFHKAHKKISYYSEGKIIEPERENAFKFEQFIFDAFKYYEKMAVLRVSREEEFAPLKNRVGKDSIETAREAYLNYRERA